VFGRDLSRRGVLAAFVWGGGLAAALVVRSRLHPAGLWSAFAAAPAWADGPLDQHHLETLIALGHVLLPSSFSAQGPAAGAVIADIVNQHLTRVAAAGAAFRDAAALLDEVSMGRYAVGFVWLDLDTRRQLLADILTPYTARRLFTRPYYALTSQGDRIRRLWSDVSQPIVVGFYTRPEGWQVVGYERRPGQCSNLIDYQFAAV
jgi:hypothetical protein